MGRMVCVNTNKNSKGLRLVTIYNQNTKLISKKHFKLIYKNQLNIPEYEKVISSINSSTVYLSGLC